MTLIITSYEAKELSGLNKNIEDRKLRPWIEMAQSDLRSTVGEDGYAAIIASLTVPTAAYTALVDGYVKPFLAYKTKQLGAMSLWSEADRNGFFVRKGESYEPLDSKGMGMMKADARDLAENSKKLMMDYVKDNETDFTWYAELCTPSQQPYTGGVITRMSDHYRIGDEGYPTDGYPNGCCDGY